MKSGVESRSSISGFMKLYSGPPGNRSEAEVFWGRGGHDGVVESRRGGTEQRSPVRRGSAKGNRTPVTRMKTWRPNH